MRVAPRIGLFAPECRIQKYSAFRGFLRQPVRRKIKKEM